jgi:hypothetical protein
MDTAPKHLGTQRKLALVFIYSQSEKERELLFLKEREGLATMLQKTLFL